MPRRCGGGAKPYFQGGFGATGNPREINVRLSVPGQKHLLDTAITARYLVSGRCHEGSTSMEPTIVGVQTVPSWKHLRSTRHGSRIIGVQPVPLGNHCCVRSKATGAAALIYHSLTSSSSSSPSPPPPPPPPSNTAPPPPHCHRLLLMVAIKVSLDNPHRYLRILLLTGPEWVQERA